MHSAAMLRRSAALLIALPLAAVLIACGIKGPLKLPPEKQSGTEAASPPASPQPPAVV